LGEFLARGRYSRAFIEDHLLPMGSAIWSVPLEAMAQFPAKSFVQFFHNHGLLRLAGRPRWRTVTGGAREYVRRIVGDLRCRARVDSPVAAVRRGGERVIVATRDGESRDYDHVVIGAHADEALAMLDEPTSAERRVLGAFRYQRNRAVLHRDPSFMPRRRRAWASWNYLASGPDARQRDAALTYWMNRLQDIDPAYPLFVTLNAAREPDPALVFAAFDYDHPVYDSAAMAAQRNLPSIQGKRGLWFCGSYCGYGFHEDGLVAGLEVAEALGVERPWAADLAAAPIRRDRRVRYRVVAPAPVAGAD
jgi:predicted NAD/FAD-binding protein